MLKPFFVWLGRGLKKIQPENVICLATEGNYTRVFLSDKTSCLVRSTLSNALKRLPRDIFIKIHRCYVVSLYYVDHVFRDHLIIGNEAVPIGRQYYKAIIDELNIMD